MQGFEPPAAYLVGRSWSQKSKDARANSCFDRLGPVDMQDPELAQLVDEACAWVRRVRAEGAGWHVLPRPSVPELYPHMGNTQDFPWRAAKKEIAERLGELTLLWYVSPEKRRLAHAAGVYRLEDPGCRAELFSIGAGRGPKLQRILDVHP
jgi:hypothetical protein